MEFVGGDIVEQIVDDQGDISIQVTIPDENGLLEAFPINLDELPDRELIFSISGTEVNLRDPLGYLIQPSKAQLCFATSSDYDKDEGCLAFLNDQRQWECQDKCLSENDGLVCGETDHFTTFALLLTGSDKQDCGSTLQLDEALYILSAVAIILMILFTLVGCIVVEIYVRIHRYHIKQDLTEVEFRHSDEELLPHLN